MTEHARSLRGCRSWLLATAIGAAVAGGCASNSSVSTGPTQTKCQVTLAAQSSTIGADGGTGTVSVTTSPECPWDVSTGATWVSGLSPTSGQGSGTVEFRVAPNPLLAAREGEIVVNDNRLRLSQQAATCRFELQPGSLTSDASGGSREVVVSSASACSWSLATDANWISFATPPTGSGTGTVGVSIAPNPGDQPRVGNITVGDQRIGVAQAGVPGSACVYLVSSTSQSVLPSAGADVSVVVTVANGCGWTASSSAAWLAVTSGAIGSGTGAVTLKAAANPGSARAGTITVAGQTFPVTQEAAAIPCAYTIAPASTSIAAPGGPGTIAVTTAGGCGWTASSNATWITVTSSATGAGSGSVAFNVAANPGAARTGTISVADQTFSVTQEAAVVPCTYTINPTSAAIAAAGGPGTISVSTSSACAWTASTSTAWVTVTSGASGTGNGAVDFTVAANAGAARTATITVADKTFTVTQAAGTVSCTYTINPTSAAIAALGGTGTIAVTAGTGCAWTASSNDAWITVTAGASGTGNGAVAFGVGVNLGSSRTGTITVAGQTFTVTQAALICTYSINPTTVTVSKKAGTGTVAVTAGTGCGWTATSNANWITVTSGATGNGSGSVAFSFTENTGKKDRTDTLTIAGRTFTVKQKH